MQTIIKFPGAIILNVLFLSNLKCMGVQWQQSRRNREPALKRGLASAVRWSKDHQEFPKAGIPTTCVVCVCCAACSNPSTLRPQTKKTPSCLSRWQVAHIYKIASSKTWHHHTNMAASLRALAYD